MSGTSKQKAFTLIELLVVVAIIGVLVAIALPEYKRYKQRGFDVGAQGDLRNAAAAQEAYFIDHNSYVSCNSSADCLSKLKGLTDVSATVELVMSGTTTAFTGTAHAASGTGATYSWDSAAGGLQ